MDKDYNITKIKSPFYWVQKEKEKEKEKEAIKFKTYNQIIA